MHSANPFVFGKFMSVQRTHLGVFGAIWVGIWVGTLVSLQVSLFQTTWETWHGLHS
jgi:hypothetical protein